MAADEHTRTPARLAMQAVERFVIPWLPYRSPTYNGVSIRPRRLWQLTEEPRYEEGLIRAIRRTVRTGDEVVIVCGGLGVSSVVAARAAGADGQVTTFEAVGRLCDRVRDTTRLNRMDERVSVRHAVIETFAGGDYTREMYGDPDGEHVPVGDLPTADVLVLDAEGAEQAILSALRELSPDEQPHYILVETHGFLRSSTEGTETLLRRAGYTVTHRATEDHEKDVRVLTAHWRLAGRDR